MYITKCPSSAYKDANFAGESAPNCMWAYISNCSDVPGCELQLRLRRPSVTMML